MGRSTVKTIVSTISCMELIKPHKYCNRPPIGILKIRFACINALREKARVCPGNSENWPAFIRIGERVGISMFAY